MTQFKEKWINAIQASVLTESINDKKIRYIEAKILPFNQVSRNGVMYSKESAEKTYKNIVGKPLMHNHDINGRENFPRGKWVSADLREDGLYGKAKVYDTSYNKDYLEWLEAEETPQVSLQISGDAESCKNEQGKYYQKANINEWLEISTVNVPGFLDAKGNFEAVMAEMLQKESDDEKEEEEEQMKEDTQVATDFKVGDEVITNNGVGKITDIQGNTAIVYIDELKIDHSVSLDQLTKKESVLREDHLNVGDEVELAGVKVKVVEVTDNGYVVEELTEKECSKSEPKKEKESYEFFGKLLEKRRKY